MNNAFLTLIAFIISFMSFSQSTVDLIGKADEFVNTQNYDDAIKAYSQAIEIDSTNAEFYYKRGWAYLYSKQDSKALSDYN